MGHDLRLVLADGTELPEQPIDEISVGTDGVITMMSDVGPNKDKQQNFDRNSTTHYSPTAWRSATIFSRIVPPGEGG